MDANMCQAWAAERTCTGCMLSGGVEQAGLYTQWAVRGQSSMESACSRLHL